MLLASLNSFDRCEKSSPGMASLSNIGVCDSSMQCLLLFVRLPIDVVLKPVMPTNTLLSYCKTTASASQKNKNDLLLLPIKDAFGVVCDESSVVGLFRPGTKVRLIVIIQVAPDGFLFLDPMRCKVSLPVSGSCRCYFSYFKL